MYNLWVLNALHRRDLLRLLEINFQQFYEQAANDWQHDICSQMLKVHTSRFARKRQVSVETCTYLDELIADHKKAATKDFILITAFFLRDDIENALCEARNLKKAISYKSEPDDYGAFAREVARQYIRFLEGAPYLEPERG